MDRTCPVCGKDRVTSVDEAKTIFKTASWGATSMLDNADYVCSWCHSVRINGEWTRMQTVSERAWRLSQGGSKSKREYVDTLTGGDLDV